MRIFQAGLPFDRMSPGSAVYLSDGMAVEGDGNYFEFGIAPATTIASKSRYPITLTLPINVGFGDDTYYPGDAFGYASISISASVPLAFLPKDFGEWKFAATGLTTTLAPAPPTSPTTAIEASQSSPPHSAPSFNSRRSSISLADSL